MAATRDGIVVVADDFLPVVAVRLDPLEIMEL
jgi:hypothetical protein